MFRPFYNQSVRKLIVAFGSLFNNIRISSTNAAGESETLRVPLSYGPKEKFLRRIEESSSISDQTKVQITLPRMGFNITDMTYDPTRKRNTLHKRYNYPSGSTGGFPTFEYSEVPYNFNISLYAFTRTMTDALQITEQILPYFTPEFLVTVNFDNDSHPKTDIPFVLNNVTLEEDYEGDMQDRRSITSQFDFTAKSYVFGEKKKTNVILYTETTLFNYIGDDFASVDISGVSGGITGAMLRADVGVSGASTDGGTGYTSGNFETYTNTYVLGPSGASFDKNYMDTFGNTYAGASANPPYS